LNPSFTPYKAGVLLSHGYHIQMNKVKISAIVHASLIVKDTKVSLDFYNGILQLPIAMTRPDLGYPGAWLNIGEQQLHLLELPNPDPMTNRPPHGGRDRHIAFSLKQIESLQGVLDQYQIFYTLSKSGRKALFVRDPDGNALEFIEQS